MALRPKCGKGARLGSSIPTLFLPRWGKGGSGPPGAPRSASLHPPHCSRPSGREEEQGQGPACGRRPVLQGRQEGSTGSVPPEPLACWSCCSSGLPVCPCSSRAGRAGCPPGGRSRPALPWRGSLPPFSLSLPQLHLGMAACSVVPTCALSTTLAGCLSPRLHPAQRCVSTTPPSHHIPQSSRARCTPRPLPQIRAAASSALQLPHVPNPGPHRLLTSVGLGKG